jgi:4-amino-4-deoxy-L-arabinose transferase-like glycosyltransferase
MTEDPGSATARRVALAGIVLIAVVVRLAGLGDRLSIDEGYSWLVGNAGSGREFLDLLAAFENTPPLFYVLLAPLPLDDEVWIRLPSLIAGVASVPVLYAVVRPLLGTTAALVAALGLAVAPYHVQFSNYSRGFVLATFALLLALWAAARLAQGGRRRWWWLYAGGAVLALYSEYDSVVFLLALVGALVVVGRPPRREALVLGLAPLLSLLPWIGEFQDSRDLAGRTKADPTNPGVSADALREQLVPLVFSEQGIAASTAVKTLLYALIVATVFLAGVLLARRSRTAFWLLAGTGLATLAGHALVSAIGPDILAARYLTALIPLAVAVLAAGVVAAGPRWTVPVVSALLVGAGVFVFFNRHDREVDPDYERVAAIVEPVRPGAVLTNSAVVAYYLDDARVSLDRPFGLGRGSEVACRRSCDRPYVVVDDDRISPPRRGPGRTRRVDEIQVRIVPR